MRTNVLRYDNEQNRWLLENASTRELMKCLDFCHKFKGQYGPSDSAYGPFMTLDEVKTELAKREHIPNKVEAKKVRQEKAKQKRNFQG